MSSGSSVSWSEMLFESFKKHGVLNNNSSTDKIDYLTLLWEKMYKMG